MQAPFCLNSRTESINLSSIAPREITRKQIGSSMTATDPLPIAPTSERGSAIIDREHLSTMTGGDTELALEIIEIFRNQAEIWARMLEPSNPPEQWADASHSLKGAALSLGANELGKVCAAAEHLGRRVVPPSIAEAGVAIADVKNALGQALEAAAHLSHHIQRTGKL